MRVLVLGGTRFLGRRVAESVRWHLDHPPTGPTWSDDDTDADDTALASAMS
ncbi:hypothetical protein EV383_3331 [Pseudonocardia sediminis]|uniref:Uncharacterized protein n=1 Tax=Pseudonocardia sediminis TaxID=1397368 RepID=A0A4Q7UX28_PSEST|nr:hypothetical protein [Pseudonocardia sediminis]RZT86436.1 hypothetical protein EV383_3331 [Pseudonocardia sediminis]